MNYQFSMYSLGSLAAGIVSLLAARLLWSRRTVPSINLLVWLEIAIAEWCLGIAIETAATTVPLKHFWSMVAYPGTVFAPVLYLLFASHYVRADHDIDKRQVILLSIVPTLVLIAAFTNPWHHLVWPTITIDPATNLAIYGHGPVFWVLVTHSYTLVVVGAVLMLRSMVHFARYYHSQLLLLLCASFLPFSGNLIYVSGYNPLPGLDWTPLAFMLTGLLLTWAVYSLRAFTILPIARDILLTHMPDCLLVIDCQQQIVDANEASAQLLGQRNPSTLFGHNLTDHLPGAKRLLASVAQGEAPDPLCIETKGQMRWLDPLLSPLKTPQGELVGRMLILRDITRSKLLETEREQLIVELQNALQEVKTLSGLLPICANCKKIRDDRGYWHGVETYVREHTGAEFSHGLCPECAQKLYADYFGDEPAASVPSDQPSPASDSTTL